MSVSLCLTIVLALALGIVSGYGAIVGILYMLNRNRLSKPTAVLIPNAGPTGD